MSTLFGAVTWDLVFFCFRLHPLSGCNPKSDLQSTSFGVDFCTLGFVLLVLDQQVLILQKGPNKLVSLKLFDQVRCGPCKLLEPALDKLAQKLCSGEFDRDGSPSPQVLRMDSDLHSAKVQFPKFAIWTHGLNGRWTKFLWPHDDCSFELSTDYCHHIELWSWQASKMGVEGLPTVIFFNEGAICSHFAVCFFFGWA